MSREITIRERRISEPHAWLAGAALTVFPLPIVGLSQVPWLWLPLGVALVLVLAAFTFRVLASRSTWQRRTWSAALAFLAGGAVVTGLVELISTGPLPDTLSYAARSAIVLPFIVAAWVGTAWGSYRIGLRLFGERD